MEFFTDHCGDLIVPYYNDKKEKTIYVIKFSLFNFLRLKLFYHNIKKKGTDFINTKNTLALINSIQAQIKEEQKDALTELSSAKNSYEKIFKNLN